MNSAYWDGHDLLAAMRHAAAVLHSQVAEVNALNVFPVPDGDTGSNMLATIQAAISEAESVPPLERSVTRVAAALSFGALMGARGNSGVILSQLLRGMGDAVAGVERIDGPAMTAALRRGCDSAFSAVAHPVEGTILTVARDVAGAAERALDDSQALEHVVRMAVAEAEASVLRTPDQLDVLKSAGVVDAGGRGLELLLRGTLASIHGQHLPQGNTLPHDIPLPTWDALEAEGFGYETVFVILPPDGQHLEPEQIRTHLETIGESVLVAGDERAVKIHVHNERPDEVIGYGLSLGTLSRINIENLDRQATDVRERARHSAEEAEHAHPAASRPGPAVVVVAAGDGLARVFATLGATSVVQGGQAANPSAGELAEAIAATGKSDVIVLPNNSNVRLAARQAGQLVRGVKVVVVPTRNAAEGVAAMLAFDPELPVNEVAKLMTDQAHEVQTLQVTLAIRDARIGGRKVRKGEFIVLGADEGLVAVDTDRTAAVSSAVRTLNHGYELLTMYRGRDVDEDAAVELSESLTRELDGIEIELVDGGQPHYHFLISAE